MHEQSFYQDFFNVQFHTKCAVLNQFAQLIRKTFSNPRVKRQVAVNMVDLGMN